MASDHPVGELSYWLVPAARGRGLAHGAVVAMRLAQRLGAERREPSRVELDRGGVARTLVVFVLTVAR
ncbi:MAG: hypothetical protein ACXVUE_14860 [Solirubrobacteraceae bacterium]